MANRFTIKIPCKPYVKAYLENNCGYPVDLTHLPELNSLLIKNLRKQQQHRSSAKVCNYSDEATLIIPNDVFYRYGWELTKDGILEFNRQAEHKVKFMMRYFISFNRSLGAPVSVCIKEFQEQYNFPEPVWPYESIKKDFDRHGKVIALDAIQQLKQEINKILLDNLSVLGTISKKLVKEMNHERA